MLRMVSLCAGYILDALDSFLTLLLIHSGGGLPQLPSSMPTIPPSLSPSMSEIPSMMPSNNSERPYSIHSILSLIGGALALIFL